MVRHHLGHKRLFQHQIRLLKPRIEIAILPFLGGFAHRQAAVAGSGKILGFPFDRLQWQPHVRHIALGAGIRTPGAQAFEGIDDEWHRLQIHFNLLNRLRRRHLIHRRHREYRLARIQRLVGQHRLLRRFYFWYVICRQHRHHPWHGEGLTGVNPAYLGVGHGAHQELGKQHALDTKILGVFRRPSHLANQV